MSPLIRAGGGSRRMRYEQRSVMPVVIWLLCFVLFPRAYGPIYCDRREARAPQTSSNIYHPKTEGLRHRLQVRQKVLLCDFPIRIPQFTSLYRDRKISRGGPVRPFLTTEICRDCKSLSSTVQQAHELNAYQRNTPQSCTSFLS